MDGTGINASFGWPTDIVMGSDNNLYVADRDNNKIRKITPEGVVSTLAGSGSEDSFDGTGTSASFAKPGSLAWAPDGNIYVSDWGSNTIRKVTPTGITTTFAGSGVQGNANGRGTSAAFDSVTGIVFDKSNNAYVAEYNERSLIRKISAPGYILKGSASGQSGTHGVSVTALDSKGGSTVQNFAIEINEASLPRFVSEPIETVDEETEYIYFVDVEQSASSALSLSSPDLPEWLSLSTYGLGVLSEFAGSGRRVELDGLGDLASFTNPNRVAIDGSGTIYVSDLGSNNIRKISPEGLVTTLAGNSSYGSADGTGTEASFRSPEGLAVDGSGNLYVADRWNHAIRKVSPEGVVTTFAGNGTSGFMDGEGTEVQFDSPRDLVFDSADNLYVTDSYNQRIRKISPSGTVSTIAGSGAVYSEDGSGSEASFYYPNPIAIDSQGNLYTMGGRYNLRKISPDGVVTTLAGSGTGGFADGTGTNVSFSDAYSIVVDSDDNIFISDTFNDRIRKVTESGVVTTVAGSEKSSFANGTGTQALFNNPGGMAIGPDGNFYIADITNRRIRKMSLPFKTLSGNPLGKLGNYDITLVATDSENNSTEQRFNLRVLDVIPPVLLSSKAVDFIPGGLTSAYIAEASDRNPISFHLGNKNDEGLFEIDSETGLVSFLEMPDFQNPLDGNGDNVYEISLEISDGANTTTQDITVTINGSSINANPTFTSFPTTEVYEGDSYEYLISTSDPEGAPVTLTKVELPDWLTLERKRSGLVSTYVGSGLDQIVDGSGTNASINGVTSMVIDQNDNLYLGDFTGRIRKVSPEGQVTTVVGGGATTFHIDKELQEGTGTDARFDGPRAMVMDDNGNIYAATNTQVIKIDINGVVSAFVGSGVYGSTDGTGSEASLGGIRDMTIDASGNLYFTEEYNHVIRKVSQAGIVTTIAGNGIKGYQEGLGTAASFSNPTGITMDQFGNLIVADRSNYRIRKIDPVGNVTSFAGSGSFGSADGSGTSAFLSHIDRLEIDKSGNLYAIEADRRIRKISPEGVVSAFAGGEEEGYADGNLAEAKFFMFNGDLVFDSSGTMLVSDSGNDRVRKIFTDVYSLKGNATGAVGPHSVTLVALDGQGGASEQSFDIDILDQLAPRFLSTPITEVKSSDEYRYVVSTELSSNQSATISAQSLPDWLRLDPYQGGVVSTVVGRRVNLPVEGSTSRVSLQNPGALAFDNQGNLFFIDASEHILRMLTPDNLVYDVAGSLNGEAGFQDGTGAEVRFNRPGYMTIDDSGNIYISDTENHSIRRVTPEGVTTTFAGTGTFGFSEGNGTEAAFSFPDDLAFDSKGNLYVADRANNRIRVIDSNGVVTTFAGSGISGNEDNENPLLATMNSPTGLAMDSNDNLYFSDRGFGAIRKISRSGEVITVAGGGQGYSDGFGTDAVFFIPQDLAIDSNDYLFVADRLNNAIRIVSPVGEVSTLAGGGEEGFIDGRIESAKFYQPAALAISPDGSMYLSDERNGAIRKISFKDPVLIGNPDGLDGPYNVELTATAPGGTTATQAFTINVIDATPPVFSSPHTIGYKENSTEVVYTAFATDINTVTYSLANAYDGTLFSIDTNSGEIRFLVSPDFEAPSDANSDNSYEVEIIASDGINEAKLTLFIKVQDARDGPLTFTSLPVTSINDNAYYSYEITTNDPAVETIAIQADQLPDWLTLNTENVGIVSTYAGDLYPDQFVDFGQITGVAIAASGKVYVADAPQALVWVVDLDGVASILAGSGKKGFGDGVGRAAHFVSPSDVAMDEDGNVIVIDSGGHRIRKVTPAGVVTTIAGSGKRGLVDGEVRDAQFNNPEFLIVDDIGNIFLTEFGNHSIRKITPEGIVSTLAGNGTAGYSDGTGTEALFNAPKGLDIDNEGNLYVADGNNRRIRKVTAAGVVSTFVGSGNYSTEDGQGTEASTSFPYDVAIGPDGNIYFSEFLDHFIRKITPSGQVTTYAGTGIEGVINGTLDEAAFDSPAGLSFDEYGNLFIAEWSGRKVRRISSGKSTLTGKPVLAGQYDVELTANDGSDGTASQTFTIEVQGTAPKLLSILRKSPVQEQIHSTSARFMVIFSKNVTNVDETDFIFNAGGVPQIPYVTKIDDHIYEVVSSGLPIGLIDLDLSSDHDIQDQSGTSLENLIPADIEETYTNANQSPEILSLPVTSVDEDELYSSHINVKDADSDIPNITAVTLPDWITIVGDFPGYISTIAGSSSSGFEDGTGASAAFRGLQDVLIDNLGNFYVADSRNNAIRKITPEGIVTTLAGSGVFGSDDGEGTTASFSNPTAIALDAFGNLIVTDSQSSKIRKVSPEGLVTTIAGSGTRGFADGTGSQASFNTPSGVAVAQDGTIYIADTWNHVIRKIDESGAVTTVAGSGERGADDGLTTTASFNGPKGLAFDSAENLYIVDSQNNGVRKMDPAGMVSTFSGGNGIGFKNGPAAIASFFQPSGIHIDASDNLYIADTENHLIRKISNSGIVSTVAGNGYRGSAGSLGIALRIPLNTPLGVTSDTDGNIFIVELWTYQMRKISDGSLTLKGDPSGQVGLHDISVTFQDSFGAKVEESFILKVNDVTDPVFTSSTTSQTNENSTDVAYDAEVTHQSSITFSLGTTSDKTLFNIDPVEGYLTFIAAPDFESPTDADEDNDYIVEIIATDAEGNSSSQTVTITVLDIEEIAPVITISSTESSRTNAQPINISFTLSEEVLGFTIDDLTIANGLVTNFTGSATSYSVDISPVTDGEITIDIAANVMTDLVGNDNEAATQFSIVSDRTAPLITIDTTEPAVTNAESFEVTFTLSDEVEGFTIEDVMTESAVFSDFTGSGTFYIATLTPLADGDIPISIADGLMMDLAGNENEPADPFVITSDRTAPVVTITSAESSVTNSTSFDITINLSEAVTGFTADDITIVNGTLSDFAGSGTAYVATATPIAEGQVTVDIAADQVTDLAGNVNISSDILSLVFDVTAPDKPVITVITDDTGSSNSDGVTNDANIIISGTAEALSTVEVFTQYGTVRTTQTDANGDWTLDITDITLLQLSFNLTAKATDLAGNQSAASDVFVLKPDYIAPAKPAITSITDDTGSSNSDGVTNDANIIIRGTAEALSTVEVFTQYGSVRSTQTDVNGDWILDITDITLLQLSFDLTAKATDLAGNKSAASDIFVLKPDYIVPAKPVITHITDDTGSSNSDGVTNDANIIISGTAEALSTIELFTQYGSVRGTQTDANGDWSLDITDMTLLQLSFNLTAKATDLAGNESAASDIFVLKPDYTAPAKPVITSITDDSGSSNSDGVTNDANIIISGTAEALSTVEVFTQYGSVRSAQTDTKGAWSLDITDITLVQLSFDLTAKATDLAGNESVTSDVFVLTVDRTPPVKPVIISITDDTGSSDSDGVTNDANIIISGTAEALSTVELFTQYGPVRSTQTDTKGDWILDIIDITLLQLSFNLTAKATDLAGNESTASDVFVLKPDYTAPTVTIDIDNNSASGYTIIALFNEDVSGLTLGEITVTGGTASNLVQLAPGSYSFLVSSAGSTADVIINANVAEDLAGNGNTASNQLSLGSTSVSAGEDFTKLQSLSKTEDINIYPNPANKVLTIDLSAFAGRLVTLSIQDATGRVRLTRAELRDNKVTLNVSSYEEGLFIIQMSDGKSRTFKKFMIRR